MLGFEGNPTRSAALRSALTGLLEVFPQHLPKPQHPTWFSPDELLRNEQFDAILRAHKKDRLTLPIEALRATGAPHHGFELLHPRRLAWLLPSILASWLDGAPSRTRDVFGADEIEAIVADVVDEAWAWTSEEDAALAQFFQLALEAALATPLRPAQPPAIERALEDGVRVWSRHSPSVPLDVLRVAKALRVSVGPLIHRWSVDETELALDHLLEAVYDTHTPSKRLLAWEPIADRLGAAFFHASGERQTRLSKAEATVRRNIARREDYF